MHFIIFKRAELDEWGFEPNGPKNETTSYWCSFEHGPPGRFYGMYLDVGNQLEGIRADIQGMQKEVKEYDFVNYFNEYATNGYQMQIKNKFFWGLFLRETRVNYMRLKAQKTNG